jgi:hypothetical protein
MKQHEAEPSPIQIDDLFHSPKSTIAKFAEAQVHLYRHDASLQDYFQALDMAMFEGPSGIRGDQTSTNPFLAWSFNAADTVAQVFKPRKIKTNILFCPMPYCSRKTENRLLVRTLLGLAETGAEILCLHPMYAPFRKELEIELTEAGYGKQIKFLDPGMSFNPIEARTRAIAGRLRGRAAFDKTIQILEPYGLSPTRNASGDFERIAQYVEAWERLAPLIEFDAVVARCHWHDLCSPVCRTGMQRGKTVITFQQGVIGHSLDFPITASKFVAFGAPSASVLAQGNRRFFDAVELPEPPLEYFNVGSLYDKLEPLPDQFSLQTVLLVDFHSVPGDPWGTEEEVQALLHLAEKLLAAKLPLRRLVIRPHPHWSDLDLGACLKLVREHRDVCELSHPVWSLEDDLRRSSVVLGVWSGVLTVASGCGLPTIFMQTEQGFNTRDLACFSPAQTLLPDAAFHEVRRLLTESKRYDEARKVALRNASEYYAGGANATLDRSFFFRLLNGEPAQEIVPDNRQ